MKKLKLYICAALAAILLASTFNAEAATPRRNSKQTAKRSTGNVTMATLERALEKVQYSEINSVAALDAKLAWAKNLQTTVVDKLVKPRAGQATDAIDRYDAFHSKFETYIFNQRKYSENNMAMAQGASISSTFVDFLMYQHINCLLDMITDENSRTAFKTCMLSLCECKASFMSLFEMQGQISGLGMGSMAAMAYIAADDSATKDINYMLMDIWKVLNGTGSNTSASTDTALASLMTEFKYEPFDEEFVTITRSEFNTKKQEFEAAARKYVTAYAEWLATCPDQSQALADKCGLVFQSWTKTLSESI